jgi:hypothetical protein
MSEMLPERRGLVGALTAVEGALLLVAGILAYLYGPTVMPVTQQGGPGGPPCGTPPGGPVPYGKVSPCPPSQSSATLLLIAAACALVALLVLPPVIGWVSARWQTALAAPSIPVWILAVVVAVLSLFGGTDGMMGGLAGVSGLAGAFSVIVSLALATQMIGLLAITVGLGGLAWLARRGFSK